MSKTSRILLGGATGLVTLSAVVLVSSLRGVDHRPYMRQAYYEETSARLAAQTASNHLAFGELWAGFGRARLTPSLNSATDEPLAGKFRSLPLAGYGNRAGKPAEGVHDDLYVKAVALRVGDRLGVIVGADALIIPPEVAQIAADQLARELKLSREQLYLSATHTHASLGGWGKGMVAEAFAGGFQPAVWTWFADRIVGAVKIAVAGLEPASFACGRFDAPQFVRNRLLNKLGKVDPEFSFVVFRSQHGGRMAVLGSYAAHATVLPSDVMEFSGDYPGAWQSAVEETTGGMAVFLAGGVGSHAPVAGEKGFAGVTRMGQALAAAFTNALAEVTFTNRVVFASLGLDVTLPPLNLRITDDIRLRPWLAQRLLRAPDHALLQVFRLDNVFWISTPCDFSGELALELKDFLRARGRDAVVTSFNGGYVGYVIPARYYHLDGYEPRLMSFFGPNVPDYFCELIRSMSLQLNQPSAIDPGDAVAETSLMR